jgi:hypothetical protein
MRFQVLTATSMKFIVFCEATGIELHPKNRNREDGLCLICSCKPLIHSLKIRRNPLPRSKLPPYCPQDKSRSPLGPSLLAHTYWHHSVSHRGPAKGRFIFYLTPTLHLSLFYRVLPPPPAKQCIHLIVYRHPFPIGQSKFPWTADSSFRARLIHRPDDGGSTHLWNVGLLQRDYTALHPTRLETPNRTEPWDTNTVCLAGRVTLTSLPASATKLSSRSWKLDTSFGKVSVDSHVNNVS